MATADVSAPVGRNGKNLRADVITVQQLLNKHLSTLPKGSTRLAVTGSMNDATIAAIEDFQRTVVKFRTPDGRVDPGGKTIRSLSGGATVRKKVAVAVHGWVGKEHATLGFLWCARTAAGEFSGPGEVRRASAKSEMVNLFDHLSLTAEVTEFRMFSHFAIGDGPMFQDGQISADELWDYELPALVWSPGARAYFHGCNAGQSGWSVVFAHTQQVNVYGSAGFAYFSRKATAFDPFPGDPDGKPCYLDNFPGPVALMQRWGVNFKHPQISDFLKMVGGKIEGKLNEWTGAPPADMTLLTPDGTKN